MHLVHEYLVIYDKDIPDYKRIWVRSANHQEIKTLL